jgi:hypothetical protein
MVKHVLSGASLRVRSWNPDSSGAAGGLFRLLTHEGDVLSGWLRLEGYRLYAVSLYDRNGRILSYLPPEFLKWYAAPALARLLQALSPAEQWVVVICSLFGAEDVLERVRRWRTVEVVNSRPEPSLSALLRCHDPQALQQVMPYLFGDATEVFLLPEVQELPLNSLSKLLAGAANLRDFQRLMHRACLWGALLRDATMLEIVSLHTQQELASYLVPLNKELRETVAQDIARMRALWQRYGESLVAQVAHQAYEEARAQQLTGEISVQQCVGTSATQKVDVLGFHFLRTDTVEFCCAVNLLPGETDTLHWVLVRMRLSQTGNFTLKSKEVSVWVEEIGKIARELYQSLG